MGKPKFPLLERHRETFLNHCKTKLRKTILQNSDKDLIEILTQCVYKMLHGIKKFFYYLQKIKINCLYIKIGNIDLTPGQ